jgi:2-polyprenyl-3-methyl-5-hydroxy-6-metoxy-1,4-benzoquinol methylase
MIVYPCIVCNNREFKEVFYSDKVGEKRDLVKCMKCGLMFLHPMPTKKELTELYSQEWDSHFGRIGASKLKSILLEKGSGIHDGMQITNRFNFIKSVIELKGKSVLEIGCAKGGLLKRLQSHGCIVKGIEPSKEAKIAEKDGIAVIGGDISEVKEKFDIILMFMVLEHLSEPIKELKEIRKRLNKNGLLFIEVPNTPNPVGLQEHILQSVFNNVHTYHFNSENLEMAVVKSGFRKFYSETVKIKELFNQNIYDFYPDGCGKIGIIKQLFILLSSVYLLFLYALGWNTNKKTAKGLNEWKGHGNWLRFVAINV